MKRIFTVSLLMIFATMALVGLTTEEKKARAKKMVEDGVAFYLKSGQDATFKEIMNKKGQFVDGEFYLFVIDFKGNSLAHGQIPDQVGKNLLAVQDSDGVYFFREFIKTASSKEGKGWVTYKFLDKANKVKPKTSFIQRIPGKDMFIGCGFYHE